MCNLIPCLPTNLLCGDYLRDESTGRHDVDFFAALYSTHELVKLFGNVTDVNHRHDSQGSKSLAFAVKDLSLVGRVLDRGQFDVPAVAAVSAAIGDDVADEPLAVFAGGSE